MTQTAPLVVLDPESPHVALPKQADMRVSIRRTLRVGGFTAGELVAARTLQV